MTPPETVPQVVIHSWLRDAGFLTLLLVLIVVLFHPLLGAGLTGDDWAILARTTHDSGPLSFILHDHSYTYLYRPLGMSFWWVTAQLFGSEAASHYATNVGLHALNTVLLFAVLRRAGVGFPGCAIAALFFAIHPVSGATTAWLSDRFDLLATGFILGALMALQRIEAGQPRARWLLALFTVLALACKETAVVLFPVTLMWSLMARGTLRYRMTTVLVAAVSVFGFLAWRQHVLGTWGGGTMTASLSESIGNLLSGLIAWASQAASVLLGRPGAFAGTLGMVLGVVLAGAVFAGYWRQHGRWQGVSWNTGVAGMVLALCAAVAQSPVTRLVLRNDNPFEIETNLRFYYLALVGVLLGVTVLLDWMVRSAIARSGRPTASLSPAKTITATAVLGGLVLALCWAPTHAGLMRWTHNNNKTKRGALEQAAVDAVRSVEPAAGCIVLLYGSGSAINEFPLFSDSIVKAQLPPGSPWLDCMVMTEREPFFTLTGLDAAAGFHDLPQRLITEGRRGPLASADLLTHFPAPFDRCDWARRDLLHAFRWNGQQFVPAAVIDAATSEPCADD